MTRVQSVVPGQILTGPLFNEPMRVETVHANGPESWSVGAVGTQSERYRKVTLTLVELRELTIRDTQHSFDGDGRLLRLGLQAYALGIAYEFDPYFGLSISRVDPLPHQLEAVYDYLLKQARVRFLLADDAGAGKTIMSGLLIRELELRGLAERILIVCPANLAFQWQRELREKFDTKFLVMKGQDLREQFGVNQWLDRTRVITSLDLAKREDILPGLRQHEKLQEIRDALDDDAVFNVVGEVLPAAHVERVLRDYYSDKLGDADLEERMLRGVDEKQFLVMEHEQEEGRQVYDVSQKNLGYDVTSLDLISGELRLIEVKGLGAVTGTILLTPNERRVAEDRRDCYWLYVVTDCNNAPRLQEPIRDPARLDWNEVTKVAHYYLSVNAMTEPMQVREPSPQYGMKDE